MRKRWKYTLSFRDCIGEGTSQEDMRTCSDAINLNIAGSDLPTNLKEMLLSIVDNLGEAAEENDLDFFNETLNDLYDVMDEAGIWLEL